MPDSSASPKDGAIDALLARLAARHPKKIDLGLDRVQTLLDRLGNPERRLPPVAHVAGTNGKGSTVAFLRAGLEAAGHSVHVYTSPHLLRFHERVRLAGRLIDNDRLQDCLEQAQAAAGDDPITFFEVTTAAAFLAFAQVPADALVLEVGLGGRLDATNVVTKPAITVISRIAMDHQAFLGDSLAAIAAEKAGIAKAAVPLVTAQSDRKALDSIARVAKTRGAKLLVGGRDWHGEASGDKLLYRDGAGALVLPRPRLPGAFQLANAALAVAALRHQQQWAVPEAALRAGLGWAEWPARLQRLQNTPLNALLPKGAALWLDGGHNPDAAQALAAHFKSQLPQERQFHLIVGMIANRDPAAFLKPFAGQAGTVHGLAIAGEDSHLAASIAAAASAVGISGRLAGDVPAALRQISQLAGSGPAPVVLIAGSLYLAGQVLRACALDIH